MRGEHSILVTLLQLNFELVFRKNSELNLTRGESLALADAAHYLAWARRMADIYRCARRSHDFDARIVAGNHLVMAEEYAEMAEAFLRLFRNR